MTHEAFDPRCSNGKFRCKSCGNNPTLDGHKADCSWNCATQALPPLNPPSGEIQNGAIIESKLTLALKRADQLDKMLAARISRSVDIENVLIKMSKGELPLPTKQDCLVLALRLGTPKKEWSETVKNHIWEGLS